MRNSDGLLLRRWGTAPASILRPPESEGIVRTDGLPASYGTSAFIALGLFNQWLKELTAFLKDGERTGLFPWKGYIDTEELPLFNADRGIAYFNGVVVRGSDGNAYICQNETDNLTNDPVEDDDNSHWSLLSDELTEYLVGGLVLGSNGMIYRCKQATDSHTQDPVTDSANTVWEPFIQTLPEGTETVQGTVRIATLTEAVEGTATNRVVTDAGVAAAINERIQQLVSDGVVDDVRLTGANNSVLRFRRTQGLSAINVDLSPLLTTFAPLLNATLTGDVNVPEPPADENSRVLATTAFARRVGDERWNQRASETQSGIVRAANVRELAGRTATGVYVDLAGLETRLANIVGLPGVDGQPGQSLQGDPGNPGTNGQAYRISFAIIYSRLYSGNGNNDGDTIALNSTDRILILYNISSFWNRGIWLDRTLSGGFTDGSNRRIIFERTSQSVNVNNAGTSSDPDVFLEVNVPRSGTRNLNFSVFNTHPFRSTLLLVLRPTAIAL